MRAAIIGAGVGGLATAIRLAKKGYEVAVYEQNDYVGGKLTAFEQDGFRFDAGPSLFTMPELVDELIELQAEPNDIKFTYKKLAESCRYFWDDGTRITASTKAEEFGKEIESVFNVPAETVVNYLKAAEFKFEHTARIFLEKSLHKKSTFLSPAIIPALLNIYKMGLFQSMHELNRKKLKHEKLTQLFNRFATYNGSNPYRAPGILTSIANLELNRGTFYPEGGMHEISQKLFATAKSLGVKFHMNSKIEKILIENKVAKGIVANNEKISADVVVSNMDVHPTYKKLMPEMDEPEKALKQERSSSAVIFYWGINRTFDELGLHNIFFSKDYEDEFKHIFDLKTVSDDPTVYVNISSKHTPTDAPEGMENWFVMINAPSDSGQDWDKLIKQIRTAAIAKISDRLGIKLADHIVTESILEPRSIERKTSSFGGALYGTSSNNRYAAFLRHPNFHAKIKNLYFSGGSVHPGGGIPLCLLSAKIIDDIVPNGTA